MLKEDIKLYVYKFSSEKIYFYFEQISEYIRKKKITVVPVCLNLLIQEFYLF